MSDQAAVPAEAAEPEPSRWRMMLRTPGRLIAALVLIVIAISVAIFATATFTSSSANAGNLVATGSLAIDNSNGGAAILTASGIVPGDSTTGTVQISNTGSSAGNFTLTTSNLKDTPTTPSLSAKLDLVIQDITVPATPTQVYSGKLNAVGVIQLGKWNGGQKHTYRFTTTFPNGTPAQDNPYKNTSTSVDFVWDAVS